MKRAFRSRLALAWLLATVLGASIFWPFAPRAHAQDIGPDAQVDSALPDAPDDYTSERVGAARWEYPARAASVARALQRTHREQWSRIVEELGEPVDPSLTIRVGRNPDEMRALAPVGAPPPAYASGVAYPSRGLILLTLTAPETWERPDMTSVLMHEMSHIALHRVLDGNGTPRWFTEGVAIYQAHEMSLERTRTLWGGAVGGRLLPLDRLSARFPSRSNQVNLAYAQSADFVAWLRGRDDGERKFRALLRRVARGMSFETALSRTYSASLTRLELDWHQSLAERFRALPLLLGSGSFWLFGALLIVLAYIKRRRRDREKVPTMGRRGARRDRGPRPR